jgi:hypothetical protein
LSLGFRHWSDSLRQGSSRSVSVKQAGFVSDSGSDTDVSAGKGAIAPLGVASASKGRLSGTIAVTDGSFAGVVEIGAISSDTAGESG